MTDAKKIPISEMPLKARDWYILVVASFEQLIGTALSATVGVIMPVILLAGAPHLTSLDQGILGASSLVGIALGSVIIGGLMDKMGYLLWFRLCPLIIAGGALGIYFSSEVWSLTLFLFIIGLGVGGGYSLDAGYISEIVPTKWESLFVGLAKASCSLGFIGGAAFCYILLFFYPETGIWPYMIFFVGIMGLIAFLLRIRWYQSPRWLMAKGAVKKAQKAAQDFLGPEAEVRQHKPAKKTQTLGVDQMFSGKSLDKVILSGISWACEGLGVYGFGVFLPILVMALGMGSGHETGIPKVMDSVRTTVFINLFIAAGFAIGLWLLHKMNILKLLGWGFILSGVSLFALLVAYKFHWPVWVSFVSFIAFEIAQNGGPHLVTYIVPSRIYTVEERGAGTGIATLLGKIGAVFGVFFMPALLAWGGVSLVLWVSIIVQAIGAAVTFIYGKKLNLL